MAASRVNSEVEEKCSFSRLLSEHFHNGLLLPSNLPTVCSHHLSEGHLAPKPLNCPSLRSSTGLSRLLHKAAVVGTVRSKKQPAPPEPLAPLVSHLPAAHRKKMWRQPLPPSPPSFLAETRQKPGRETLQATSKSCQGQGCVLS
jgi:hypothetical protein